MKQINGKLQSALPFLAIAAVAACVYFPSLRAPFIFDDYANIVYNPDIKQLANLKSKLFYAMPQIEPNRNLPTRPLFFLTLTLNYAMGGLNTFGYHAVNLILHTGSAFLVFLLAKKLTGGNAPRFVPVFAALLFAAHPMQTDAVSYVSNRTDGLATFFYLFAVWTFLRGQQDLKDAVLCLTGFALALASKEIAITLPLVIFLADYFFVAKQDLRAVARNNRTHIALWGAAIAFVLARQFYFGRIGFGGKNLSASWTPLSYLRTQIVVVQEYVRLLFLPIGQCLDHQIYPTEGWKAKEFLRAVMIWAVALPAAAAVLLSIKRKEGDAPAGIPHWAILAFACAWFFITLAPTSSFLPIFDAMVERRAYLPSVGFCLGVAILLWRLSKYQRTATLALAAFSVIAAAALTYRRNLLYAEPALLWEEAIARYPNNARAYNNAGIIYFRSKQMDKAVARIAQAAAMDPTNVDYQSNLGSAYYQMGDSRNAFLAFQKCADMNPRDAIAQYNLGNVFMSAKDMPRAELFFKKSIELDPRYAESYGNLGVIYFKKGDVRQAAELSNKCIALNPDYAIPYNWLGKMALEQGKHEEADAYFQKALELSPAYSEPLANLGDISVEAGDLDRAEALFKKALESNPNLAEAFDGLGRVHYARGHWDQALDCYLKVIELNPNNASAYHNLGAAFFQKGNEDKALECYKKAVSIKPDFPQPYNDIGIILMGQKKYRDAEKYFRISIDMNPKFSLAQENLADLYLEQKDYSKALAAYQRVASLEPGRQEIAAKIARIQSFPKR